MAEFQTVCRVGDLADGEGKAVEAAGKLIAVFRQDGQFFAIDDVCPHMGASLSTGDLENAIVTCPWHAWRFKTCDGTWCDNPRIKIESFEVRLEGDDIQVRVPERPRRQPM